MSFQVTEEQLKRYWPAFTGCAVVTTSLVSAYTGYGLVKAIIAKTTVTTIYDCFCKAVLKATESGSQEVCQAALDYVYGQGLYPSNLTLFCGEQGSMALHLTSTNGGLAGAIIALACSLLGIVAVGKGIYTVYCKPQSEPRGDYQEV